MDEQQVTSKPSATMQQVAEFLGVNERTVRRWVADSAMPHYRTPGGTPRFDLEEVRAWCAREGQPPASQGKEVAG